jgi:hypothetical protein
MTNNCDVIVIGGGPAGMMAAGRAGERGRRVLLLEKNKILGRKLALTGGGRCNITNAEENMKLLLAHYGPAEKFLYSSFVQFGIEDTVKFFEERGLPFIVQAGKRAFPKTEKADDVVKTMIKYLAQGRVEVRTNMAVKGFVIGSDGIKGVEAGNEVLTAKTYILATGGMSRPDTGSTGDGLAWLQRLGHQIEAPSPTVVPLAVRDKWIKSLAGVSLDNVKITFFADGVKKITLKGRVLCTHFGLSGPLIINAAGKVADLLRSGQVTVTIDLFPTVDLGALDEKVIAIFNQNKNKEFKNVIKQMVPAGTAGAILTLLQGIDADKPAHSITKMERKKLIQLLKSLPGEITGLMGYERAVVSDGGVTLNEIDGKTMRSRRCQNLFVTGDLLHINRPSGGYSLQLCWTTGWVAGSNA